MAAKKPFKRNSPYLNTMGLRLVHQLFIEYADLGPNDFALYTMHREDAVVDGKTYPSLYLLYMEENDITEARFVQKYLYDWEQWEKIVNSAIWRDEVKRWRKDLKAHIMGTLFDELLTDALSGSKSSKSSAKFLVDKLSKGTKGKPVTAIVETSEESHENMTKGIYADAKRLQLVK